MSRAVAPPDEHTEHRRAAFEAVRAEALGCTRCRLCENRNQVVFGTGNPDAELIFVGEGPGAEEDRQGLPFVGRSGKLLDRFVAEEMGLTRDDVYIANVVKCRPPENRDPKPDEVAACRGWLETQVGLIRPRVIVTLGNFASRLLLDTTVGITRLRGHAYRWSPPAGPDRPDSAQDVSVVLVPTLHPAAVLRGGGTAAAAMRADLVRAKSVLAGDPVVLSSPEEVAP